MPVNVQNQFAKINYRRSWAEFMKVLFLFYLSKIQKVII